MALVRLMKGDGTTLRDGRHNLIVYKMDAKKADDAKTFMTLPGTWAEVEEKEKQSGKPFHHSGVVPKLEQNLQRLMEVEGAEIFLQDTLDALFSIMMETSEKETYDMLVFNALFSTHRSDHYAP
ncbi:hypothetical protein CRUP_023918 [Coryphaenoides rupestris]|nr:hypothetical protein CRUP_023918 [Coryphaenoides rupestris]